MNEFTAKIVECIRHIPYGKVSTYGAIAMSAGNSRGARQVSWTLHSQSEKEQLPWYRVVSQSGKISIKDPFGYQIQKSLLEKEGIVFGINDCIDLEKYGF